MTSLIVKMHFQNKLEVLTKINPELSLSLRCRGCSAAILHLPPFTWFSCWLHCTDHWIFETWGFNINHSRMFWFKLWNSDGWMTQESMCEQELQRLAVSPQKSCLEPQPGGKSRSTRSFYTLALNRSRKAHTLKCKWYFLALTTRSPSDLQITASES